MPEIGIMLIRVRTYTGPVEYYGTTYYIQKGYLNWTYSASIELNGVTYQVKHGVVKKAL